MAVPQNKRRKGLPKKKKESSSSLLFSFLDDIMVNKTNILTDENKHAYSKYMITQFLSMHEAYIPIVDLYLNKYQDSLPEAEFHKLCIALIPKKKVYLKYIGGKKAMGQCKNEVKVISEYFGVNENRAFEYYEIAGDELVENIQRLYGIIE